MTSCVPHCSWPEEAQSLLLVLEDLRPSETEWRGSFSASLPVCLESVALVILPLPSCFCSHVLLGMLSLHPDSKELLQYAVLRFALELCGEVRGLPWRSPCTRQCHGGLPLHTWPSFHHSLQRVL